MKQNNFVLIKQELEGGYSLFPTELLFDTTISDGALRLLNAVIAVDDSDLPDSYYAKRLGITMSTLYRRKKELKESRYIK